MGKFESLDKLKNIVIGVESFGFGDDDVEIIVFFVIDFFLVIMGGVESFEEDEDSNFFSVMLNFCVVIVFGEFIFWLFCLGDSFYVMFLRICMVWGLFVILWLCMRNRVMCSMVGLLGVLL